MTSGILYFDDSVGFNQLCTLTGTTNQIDVTNPNGVGGNPTFSISSNYTGVPGQRFFAHVNATVNNVTGNGTAYTIIANTELYDVGNNYNNATGIFTAPKSGVYLFGGCVSMGGISLLVTNFNINFVQAGSVARNFQCFNLSGISLVETAWANNHSVPIQMTSGDTLKMVLIGSGQLTAAMSVVGNATNPQTYFWGQFLG